MERFLRWSKELVSIHAKGIGLIDTTARWEGPGDVHQIYSTKKKKKNRGDKNQPLKNFLLVRNARWGKWLQVINLYI